DVDEPGRFEAIQNRVQRSIGDLERAARLSHEFRHDLVAVRFPPRQHVKHRELDRAPLELAVDASLRITTLLRSRRHASTVAPDTLLHKTLCDTSTDWRGAGFSASYGSRRPNWPAAATRRDPSTGATDRLKLAVRWLSSVKTIAPLRITP